MIRLLIALVAFVLPVSAMAAGGVVSSADPRATAAGQEMLRAGGSAADAAMAMMLALTVVEPQFLASGAAGSFFITTPGPANSPRSTAARKRPLRRGPTSS